MKELDYIIQKVISEIEVDETIISEDKILFKQKCLAAKYKLESDLLQFKRINCGECKESLCPKKEIHCLHCMTG